MPFIIQHEFTSPYCKNYSYIINPTYCEDTLRNFNLIKNSFLFSPLYARTNRPILVLVEDLQSVEGRKQSVCMGTLLTASTGTECWTSWQAESRHQWKHTSSTTSWLCNPTATLICTPVHLPPVSHE